MSHHTPRTQRPSTARLFVVDTLATVLFFTAVASFSELFIAGLEAKEVLATRILMVPIMIATARPYTGWRDWLLERAAPRNRITTTLVDIGAFLTFQGPVYGATLLLAGAELAELGAALGSALVFMILLARPFGLFVEWVRVRFG
ncbi:L-alanine exporter AlaE [Salipiger sp. IMCC34102]|uniref:L-alanine exporter AlaE n=1 Tax=Salipiger sp. IMCC34102 TaxID=2510647 RepID=UPI00101B919C|nr:L-alanine exporter AlaE [Salipiger sp. IMCC34102]RYH02111.1 L-alanine exporter AlaE [Salipiger sp. IMCC34102]